MGACCCHNLLPDFSLKFEKLLLSGCVERQGHRLRQEILKFREKVCLKDLFFLVDRSFYLLEDQRQINTLSEEMLNRLLVGRCSNDLGRQLLQSFLVHKQRGREQFNRCCCK